MRISVFRNHNFDTPSPFLSETELYIKIKKVTIKQVL